MGHRTKNDAVIYLLVFNKGIISENLLRLLLSESAPSPNCKIRVANFGFIGFTRSRLKILDFFTASASLQFIAVPNFCVLLGVFTVRLCKTGFA